MHAPLDALLTAIYVLTDGFLPTRSGPGRPPRITDAELITLAIAQVFLGIPNDRQFLAMAGYRLRHLFGYLPKQPADNKRLRRLTAEIERTINYRTCKGQLGLERHGARVGMRLLALAAGLFHNAMIGRPGRSFAAYGH